MTTWGGGGYIHCCVVKVRTNGFSQAWACVWRLPHNCLLLKSIFERPVRRVKVSGHEKFLPHVQLPDMILVIIVILINLLPPSSNLIFLRNPTTLLTYKSTERNEKCSLVKAKILEYWAVLTTQFGKLDSVIIDETHPSRALFNLSCFGSQIQRSSWL